MKCFNNAYKTTQQTTLNQDILNTTNSWKYPVKQDSK